jgi:hypothetical protein
MDDLPENLESSFDGEQPADDPELVDIPMDEIIGVDPETSDVTDLSEMDLLRKVMSKGSVMFSDGRMLTKCPAYNTPAICGMYPMPHPQTGDTTMVCTGPTISEKTAVKLFGENETYYSTDSCHWDCPYHPNRLNEEPEYREDSRNEDQDGWL